MFVTGKSGLVAYGNKTYRFLNQRSREWTHPYEYPPRPGGTLTDSGCGIFSACHAVEVMCGKRISPEELADFSCREGGRGEDGTNRPKLLSAMRDRGLLAEYGMRYEHTPGEGDHEGHSNDREALWRAIVQGGCALSNLRPGHIVTLIDGRVIDGERQVLAMDCHSESGDSRVKDFVREVLPASEVVSPVFGEGGLVTGYLVNYGLFWVPLTLPRDFDLLYPIE